MIKMMFGGPGFGVGEHAAAKHAIAHAASTVKQRRFASVSRTSWRFGLRVSARFFNGLHFERLDFDKFQGREYFDFENQFGISWDEGSHSDFLRLEPRRSIGRGAGEVYTRISRSARVF